MELVKIVHKLQVDSLLSAAQAWSFLPKSNSGTSWFERPNSNHPPPVHYFGSLTSARASASDKRHSTFTSSGPEWRVWLSESR